MKNTLNRILAVCCGLILIGCNSGGGGGGAPINPPSQVNISLSSGSDIVNVPTKVSLTLNFTEAVNGVNPNNVRVESTGSATNVIPQESAPSRSGNNYTFIYSGLTNATTYTVSLSNGITSVATGQPIRSNPLNFTTVAPGTPTVQIIYPINNSTGVALNSFVTLEFSEVVKGVSPATLTWSSSSGNVIPFNIESNAIKTLYTLTLESGRLLSPNTVYNVQVIPGITASADVRCNR